METKVCSKCGEEKELEEFYKNKFCIDGLYGYCKKCAYKQHNKWKKDNPNKVKKQRQRWYKKCKNTSIKQYKIQNKNKINKRRRKWYQKNRNKEIIRQTKWRINNSEKIKVSQKKYYDNHVQERIKCSKRYRKEYPDKIKEFSKNYYKNNKERILEYSKKWIKDNKDKINKRTRIRRENDIHYKLKKNVSSIIFTKLKKRLSNKCGKSTFSFLPYTIDDLIKHLESQFESWMNWQNYGFGKGKWVIDHKIPDSSFGYKSVEDEEFQKCWALGNLQPMEFIENIKKSNKII